MSNTTTERRLAITPGDWFLPQMAGPYNVPGTTASGKGDWCYYVNSKEAHERCPASAHGASAEEARVNAELIADAGTTYNSCGMLPSEMLAKLREAVKLLNAARADVSENASRHLSDADSFEGKEFAMCIIASDAAAKNLEAINAFLSTLNLSELSK